MKHLMNSLCVALLLNLSVAHAAVQLKPGDSTVDVSVDGKPFMTFHYGENWPKPFFSPVRASNGTVLTRPIENPKDHPHHKGIWLSVDEVNGVKFWAEKGKIVNRSLKIEKATGNPAVIAVVNDWMGEGDHPEIVEHTTIRIYQNRMVSYDVTFKASAKDAVFEDTKEGLFGFRLADPLRETENGKVVNSEGQQGTAECWGQIARWVDYSGEIEGHVHGVAIFDHPGNFRPSRYHVRNYGLFSVSPFGEKAYTKGAQESKPLHLSKGESVRLRYAMYIHDGDAVTSDVAGAYAGYLKSEP